MASTVQMMQRQSGIAKTGFYGFSWTSFFFSGIPALMRGDLGYGLGILAAGLVLGFFSFGILGLIVNLVWAFVYNKNYTQRLMKAGFEFSDAAQRVAAARAALGVSSPAAAA